MKRLIVLLMVGTMVLSMSACKKNTEQDAPAPAATEGLSVSLWEETWT